MCSIPEPCEGTWVLVRVPRLGVKMAPQSYIWKCQECDEIGGSPNRDHPCSVCNEDCLVGGYLVLQAAREVSASRRTRTFQLHCCRVFITRVVSNFISQPGRKTCQQKKCQEAHLREGGNHHRRLDFYLTTGTGSTAGCRCVKAFTWNQFHTTYTMYTIYTMLRRQHIKTPTNQRLQ